VGRVARRGEGMIAKIAKIIGAIVAIPVTCVAILVIYYISHQIYYNGICNSAIETPIDLSKSGSVAQINTSIWWGNDYHVNLEVASIGADKPGISIDHDRVLRFLEGRIYDSSIGKYIEANSTVAFGVTVYKIEDGDRRLISNRTELSGGLNSFTVGYIDNHRWYRSGIASLFLDRGGYTIRVENLNRVEFFDGRKAKIALYCPTSK
jgi:hypothetical protein